ncbi:VWA domain-containing protein [Tenacibaculum sp. 47A_GOM-205m]|uniref:vWA domain-containing protein n=1 Tax=Tenacibaculum sp. 47A_GOM-205m TaxID=1380384 RepID=UPI00048F4DEA|nr:VWA domain-containing protein [Tenacibaculum sp. 47A_GOM-205m]
MFKKLFYAMLLLSSITLVAQQRTITGVVSDESGPLPGVTIVIKGTTNGTETDFDGRYSISANKGDVLVFSFVGMKTLEEKVKESSVINIIMKSDNLLEEVVITKGLGIFKRKRFSVGKIKIRGHNQIESRDSYAGRNENVFKSPINSPLSTFSIDVDKASYSNIRRMINNGQKVPKEAVKIEEMINYFDYKYPQPTGKHPFSINTEVVTTPWNKDTQLIRIGLKGKEYKQEKLPASNLTFLIDVSGSMSEQNKLPLLKSAFKLLVNQLREKDRVAIVVYAGAAGVVLKPTSGNEKGKIVEALNQLEAGGSTAGGEGIELAYKLAKENYIEDGNNRVILASDGDFNVGASSNAEMEELIEEKRKSGVFLSVLGFGYGNYQDDKLEILADKGNGNHAYIDTMQEAQKVLGKEFGGTLHTIAKDVKIQVEFNPKKVQAYRLIGYENRLLNDEDFVDDTKDAGELGSGHTVTALYEVIPVGVKSKFLKNLPKLKYTQNKKLDNFDDELLTVKFRYKLPKETKSIELVKIVKDEVLAPTNDMNFISAVALFGMQLSKSKFKNKSKIEDVLKLVEGELGEDKDGYRSEFVRLIKTYN